MHIAMLAGEPSGDQLGAALMEALRQINPTIRFDGVGGEKMQALGFKSLIPQEELAVMGISEVVASLPKLLRIRKQLFEIYQSGMPDVFIGIDYPDFNLSLEKRLKEAGVPTVHYVSPSVWAWREGRVHGIKRSVDLMLTLFDFEKKFYDKHDVPAIHCGHPLVDMPSIETSPAKRIRALSQLNLNVDSIIEHVCPVAGIFPGSRVGEVKRMMPVFAKVAQQANTRYRSLLGEEVGDIKWLISATNPDINHIIQSETRSLDLDVMVTTLDAKTVLQASDAVMLTSGTITLEAMLMQRPMIVSYKVSTITAMIARMLLRTQHFSLPNIIADHPIVPEYIQGGIDIDEMSTRFLTLLINPERRHKMLRSYEKATYKLKSGGAETAARAVYDLINTQDFE